jgi:hypothetical protein
MDLMPIIFRFKMENWIFGLILLTSLQRSQVLHWATNFHWEGVHKVTFSVSQVFWEVDMDHYMFVQQLSIFPFQGFIEQLSFLGLRISPGLNDPKKANSWHSGSFSYYPTAIVPMLSHVRSVSAVGRSTKILLATNAGVQSRFYCTFDHGLLEEIFGH